MMRTKNSYLYVFATFEEFLGVFPETAASVANQPIANNIISLFDEGARGSYACVAGVGLVDFSAGLSRILSQCLAEHRFISAVVNLGVCGAYPQSGIPVGEVVNIVSEIVGDLGFQENDGSFVPWHTNRIYEHSSKPLNLKKPLEEDFLTASQLRQVKGLTVNCCTGTAQLAKVRYETFGGDVESMEGAATFAVCNAFGFPVYEIRAVSNIASTRDKSQWKIKEALENLHIFICG